MNADKRKVTIQLCVIGVCPIAVGWILYGDKLIGTLNSKKEADVKEPQIEMTTKPLEIAPPRLKQVAPPVASAAFSNSEIDAIQRLANIREAQSELQHARLIKEITETLAQKEIAELELEEKRLQVDERRGSKPNETNKPRAQQSMPPLTPKIQDADILLHQAIGGRAKTKAAPKLKYMTDDHVVIDWESSQIQLRVGTTRNGLKLEQLDNKIGEAVVVGPDSTRWVLGFNTVVNRVVPDSGEAKPEASAPALHIPFDSPNIRH